MYLLLNKIRSGTGYLICIVIALAIIILIILSYYYLTLPTTKVSNVKLSQTTFHSVRVRGAIQPIPKKITTNIKWVELGKALFNSKLLSKDNTIACASCHLIKHGGDDGFQFSTGVNNQQGTRNSPTILNAVFNFRQFWDGRSKNLTEQISDPINNPIEMATNWPDVIAKLNQSSTFKQAFKRVGNENINQKNIVKAITVFEESLITPHAPIDKFILGDNSALTVQQQRGLKKFIDFGCITCHQGQNIGGNLYQKLGRIDFVPENLQQDLGRFTLTNKESDRFVFKVPSLRNIAQTAPYFHNGSVESLERAVQIMARAQLGLSLSEQDTEDLVALLQAFTGKLYNVRGNR